MARFARAGMTEIDIVLEDRTIVEVTGDFRATDERHDDRAARIAYYQRIAELLEDGWRRVSRFEDDIFVPTDPPALITSIEANEPGALDVFIDWLLEHNDPRGELATLRAAAEPDPRKIQSLEKTRGLELFGPLSTLSRRWHEQFTFVWQAGWVDQIVFGRVTPNVGFLPPEAELMRHVMHAPMARFARRLVVDDWYVTPLWECLRDDPALARFRTVQLFDSALAVEDRAIARRRLEALGIELTYSE